MVCTKTIRPVPGGYRFEVKCGGKVVACGSRSTHALADTAANREVSVFGKVRAQGGGGAKARGGKRKA